MEVKSTDASGIFKLFTSCATDPKTFLLDVRPQKLFQKGHVALSYNIRLSANGQALLDYSKNQYDVRFSKDCWWGKPVIVIGEENLKKDHPVIKFLAQENRCESLKVFRQGYAALEKGLPFICTQSLKANCARRYPSEILAGELYLGEWSHAQNADRLAELNVRRVITIHNSPENLELPAKFKHMRIQLADVDTQNIAPFFNSTYDFVEAGRSTGHATLIHCGAGVSRSATLAIAYLMRHFMWNATKARAHCVERRSSVYPNDGFWRSLCAFEAQLGIKDRSDVNQGTVAWHGNDAPVAVAEDAAGAPVTVTFLTVRQLQAEAKAAEDLAASLTAAADSHAVESTDGVRENGRERQHEEPKRRRHRSRSRSRSRERHHSSSRRHSSQHESDRRYRDGHRNGDRDRDRGRDRDRDRNRDRHRHRHREYSHERRHHSESEDREQPDERSSLVAVAPPEPPQPAKRAVFEVSKDGKVAGHLRLGLEAANQRAVVGRVPSCDVHLEHLSISRHHAALTTDPVGHLFLTDLGAAHGTNIDGVWIKPNVGRQLVKENVIRFGASTRQYKVIELPGDQAKESHLVAKAAHSDSEVALEDQSDSAAHSGAPHAAIKLEA